MDGPFYSCHFTNFECEVQEDAASPSSSTSEAADGRGCGGAGCHGSGAGGLGSLHGLSGGGGSSLCAFFYFFLILLGLFCNATASSLNRHDDSLW